MLKRGFDAFDRFSSKSATKPTPLTMATLIRSSPKRPRPSTSSLPASSSFSSKLLDGLNAVALSALVGDVLAALPPQAVNSKAMAANASRVV